MKEKNSMMYGVLSHMESASKTTTITALVLLQLVCVSVFMRAFMRACNLTNVWRRDEKPLCYINIVLHNHHGNGMKHQCV